MPLWRLIRNNPFVRLLFFLMMGITAGFFIRISLLGMMVTSIISISLFITLCFTNRHPVYNTGLYAGILAAVFFFLCGSINMGIHEQMNTKQINNLRCEQQQLQLEIVDSPEETTRSYRALAKIVSDSFSYPFYKPTVLVYFEKTDQARQLEPGWCIHANGRLQPIPPAANPDQFDYRKYMALQSVSHQVYLTSENWTLSSIHFSLRSIAYRARQKVLTIFRSAEQDTTLYALVSSITLGYKSDLDAQTKVAFSRAGVMHVMALSGFNVAVIAFGAGCLLFFLDKFKYGKLIKTGLIVFMIWSFAFMTGLSPSVTRAALMITLVMAGSILDRKINSLNILFATAFLLLTLNPALIFNVSFQLSFSAVLGIISFNPLINKIVTPKNRIVLWIWQLFSVSCAAQLATLPLTLYYFHQFPVYFWLTNLFVVPLVSVIICTAGILMIVSTIHSVAFIIGFALHFFLKVLYHFVIWAATWPFAIIDHIYINIFQVFLLFLIVLSLTSLVFQRIRILVIILPLLLLAFQIVNLNRDIRIKNQNLFLIGESRNISSIHFISGRSAILYVNDTSEENSRLLTYTFENWWIRHGVARTIRSEKLKEVSSFDFPEKKLVILNRTLPYSIPLKPIKADLIVVTDKVNPDVGLLMRFFDCPLIILDSSVDHSTAGKWVRDCKWHQIDCWPVKQKGAFLLD